MNGETDANNNCTKQDSSLFLLNKEAYVGSIMIGTISCIQKELDALQACQDESLEEQKKLLLHRLKTLSFRLNRYIKGIQRMLKRFKENEPNEFCWKWKKMKHDKMKRKLHWFNRKWLLIGQCISGIECIRLYVEMFLEHLQEGIPPTVILLK